MHLADHRPDSDPTFDLAAKSRSRPVTFEAVIGWCDDEHGCVNDEHLTVAVPLTKILVNGTVV